MSKSEPTTTTKPKRDHHGFRGLPPPPTDFSLASLADDALLTEFEVAAILRVSTNTLGSWRQQPGHPLRWRALPNGFIRYTAGHVREFLASGKPRPPRGRPPATKPKPPKPAGTLTASARIDTRDAAPERCRAPKRLRAADAAAPTGSSS